MIIDNYAVITPLLDFTVPGRFYMLQLLKRRKDPGNEGMKQGVRVILQAAITSLASLESRYSELIDIANVTNSRIVINLNSKCMKKCSLQMIRHITDSLEGNQFAPHRVFNKAAGALRTAGQKHWIIDVDDKDYDINGLIDMITEYRPVGFKHVITVPTPNGYHVITKPFNPCEVNIVMEIKKDNPTVLYCCDFNK